MSELALLNQEKTSDRDPESAEYRVMPHNEEAEQALLGALLSNNRAYERVAEFLEPEHFYSDVHGRIYQSIGRLVERGQVANPVTLKALFSEDEALSHVGGAQYLVDLAASVVSIINVEDYGRTIFESHLRRELITLGEAVTNDAYIHDLEKPPLEQIEEAEARLFRLAEFGEQKGGFVSLEDSIDQVLTNAKTAFQSGSEVTGITSGFMDVDSKMGGLHRSDLIILAGRPSMGKTALATNIAYKSAKTYAETNGEQGARVAFFSLEMSSEQLALRILSDAASIPSDKIRRGKVSEQEFLRFADSSNKLTKLPLYIDDTPAITIAGIRTRARRLQRQKGLDLIVVDYLQLIGGSRRRANENRVQEISEISRGLKTLAKELQVPVLALSQLSRQVEQRDNKRPQLSDLRESGSIEQDADVVMFVYREEYYLAREEPSQRVNESSEKFLDRHNSWKQRLEDTMNIAEVILGKQRHGPIGTINLRFTGEFTRFSDLDQNHGG